MSFNLIPVIGLEIHAELKTATKMFSRVRNHPHEDVANLHIDPVTMAEPGTLPVINMQAVQHMICIGLALNAEIANYTEFDRKHYFYPDIPKGYQISQYQYPIVSGGTLHGVRITRVHLEEDTGTSKHDQGDYSLIDFNRAGVPLMEMVTEPVIHSPQEAGDFGRELQMLLRYLGASDANMEKGELRVEVNISLAQTDLSKEDFVQLYEQDKKKYLSLLGTKTEIKNINSFRSAEKAAQYEIERMTALIEAGRGDEIVQETRGWDDVKGITFSQRKKENASDYRYFPDPDLPKLYLHELFNLESLKSELPELPADKRNRYRTDFTMHEEALEVLMQDQNLSEYFEIVAQKLSDVSLAKIAVNYLTSDFIGLRKDNPEIALPDIDTFSTLVRMIGGGIINSRGGKDILSILVHEGGDPEKIAQSRGLIQNSDPSVIKTVVEQVIDNNAGVVEQWRQGDEKVLKFLIGQIMKASKGSANPVVAEEVLRELLQ